MDILNLLWTAFAFVLSILWSLAWFVLRDLISTLLWILIVAWLLLSVRYRSFVGGSVAILRYGSYGLNVLWRWLRGTPSSALSLPPPKVITKEVVKYVPSKTRHRPFGTMSISEQLNMLLIGSLYLLLFN
jgi:hypothetical protein